MARQELAEHLALPELQGLLEQAVRQVLAALPDHLVRQELVARQELAEHLALPELQDLLAQVVQVVQVHLQRLLQFLVCQQFHQPLMFLC